MSTPCWAQWTTWGEYDYDEEDHVCTQEDGHDGPCCCSTHLDCYPTWMASERPGL